VGFLDAFRRNGIPSQLATWQSDAPPLDLQTVTLQSLYPGIDADELPMFRREAQTIPGVMAIENLLTSTISPLTLQAVDAEGKPLAVQPAWTTRTDANAQNPYMRLGRTVADIYYSGISLWSVDARDNKGYPLSMSHVRMERWSWDDGGQILIDGKTVPANSIVLFESIFPGLLTVGGRTLRSARDIERTIRARARIAIPTQALKNKGDGTTEPDEDEKQAMLQAYSDQRRALNGAVIYVPGGYDLENLEDFEENWLLPARAAVITDLAKITGIPSGLIEGDGNGTLNYTTELGQLARFLSVNLNTFTAPITSRLSMGDVTPRGTSIQLDLSHLQQEAPEPLTDKGVPVTPNTSAKEPNTNV